MSMPHFMESKHLASHCQVVFNVRGKDFGYGYNAATKAGEGVLVPRTYLRSLEPLRTEGAKGLEPRPRASVIRARPCEVSGRSPSQVTRLMWLHPLPNRSMKTCSKPEWWILPRLLEHSCLRAAAKSRAHKDAYSRVHSSLLTEGRSWVFAGQKGCGTKTQTSMGLGRW